MAQRDKDPVSVAGIAVTRNGRLLWIRRRDNGKLTLPGGHLEVGEEPFAGAMRELNEETGFSPNGSDIEVLGDMPVPSNPQLNIFSFTVEVPEGDPTAEHDPDNEAAEYSWLDDLPPTQECHVPHSDNVTLRLLGLIQDESLEKSEAPKEWRSKDGLKIPHQTSPERPKWDKAYHGKLVEIFGRGNPDLLRKIKVPVTEQMSGHFVQGAVGPGGRDRRSFYSRMAAAGERLPPIVVRRNGIGWHVVDGNARLTAALKHGLPEMDAYEILDKPEKPKPIKAKTKVKKPLSPTSDADFEDEDGWTEAKYRRGGEHEFSEHLKSKGILQKSLIYGGDYGLDRKDVDADLLYRAYKNSPHHPLSLLLKYVVHRIENRHFYDTASPKKQIAHDRDWLAHHQQGGAADKNGHVTVSDLRSVYKKKQDLLETGVLAHQMRLHEYLKKYNPDAIKTVNGEPSVPLARGYRVKNPGADHELASYSDSPATAASFGDKVKKWWVPLKNLWYSYDLGAKSAAGNMGPEDEFLSTNHPRVPVESDTKIEQLVPRGSYGYVPPDSTYELSHTSDKRRLDALADTIRRFNNRSFSPDAEREHLMDIGAIVQNPHATPSLLKAIYDFTPKPTPPEYRLNKRSVLRHPNAPSNLLDDGMRSENPGDRRAVIENPNATSKHVDDALMDVDPTVVARAYHHPNLTPDSISKIIASHRADNLLDRDDLSSEHINQIINDPDQTPGTLTHVSRHKELSNEQIDKIIWHPRAFSKEAAIQALERNPNLSSDQIEHILTKYPYPQEDSVYGRFLEHPNLPEHRFQAALKDQDSFGYLLGNPRIQPHHLTGALKALKGLKDSPSLESSVRDRFWAHPNITSKDLSERLDSLNSEHPSYESELAHAAEHSKATPEVLSSIIKKSKNSPDIFNSVVCNENATAQNLNEAYDSLDNSDKDKDIILDTLLDNPNATPEHIEKGLGVKRPSTVAKAISHPNATQDQLIRATQSDMPEVAKIAKERIKRGPAGSVANHTKALTEKHGWRQDEEGLHKSEEFVLSKAIANIAPGKKLGLTMNQHTVPHLMTRSMLTTGKSDTSKMARFDYSHLIKSPALKGRYGLVIDHLEEPEGHFLRASVIDRASRQPVGHLDGYHQRDTGHAHVDYANLEHSAQGKGLGKALYEAMLAHNYHHHGARTVSGDWHSSKAHRVHQALATTHGFEGYAPTESQSSNKPGDLSEDFDNKFGPYEYTMKSELDVLGLVKSIGKTLGLVGALALGGHAKADEPARPAETKRDMPKWTSQGLHAALIPIAHLESSFGTNLDHQKSPKGDYDTAFGALGFKPMTAHETYLSSPALQQRFGELKDPADFTAKFKSDPQFYNLVATAHFMRLMAQHGGPEKASYAWRYGTNAAAGASSEQVENDPYVIRYRALSHATGLKKMAMKDIKPGPRVENTNLGGMLRHDYTHLLKPEHQAGYSLHVEHWPKHPDSLYAALISKATGAKVGHIDAGVGRTEEGHKAIETTVSRIDPSLFGKGFGRALYEAVLSHGYHILGIKHVVGDTHSSMAHKVHASITKRHGFPGYDPNQIGRAKGPNDNAYGEYSYHLK
jgi:8-oxo-dGTP pyrophosphatase MutT (NUDIX family)/GNAT superfamily N-acetyltransferase